MLWTADLGATMGSTSTLIAPGKNAHMGRRYVPFGGGFKGKFKGQFTLQSQVDSLEIPQAGAHPPADTWHTREPVCFSSFSIRTSSAFRKIWLSTSNMFVCSQGLTLCPKIVGIWSRCSKETRVGSICDMVHLFQPSPHKHTVAPVGGCLEDQLAFGGTVRCQVAGLSKLIRQKRILWVKWKLDHKISQKHPNTKRIKTGGLVPNRFLGGRVSLQHRSLWSNRVRHIRSLRLFKPQPAGHFGPGACHIDLSTTKGG